MKFATDNNIKIIMRLWGSQYNIHIISCLRRKNKRPPEEVVIYLDPRNLTPEEFVAAGVSPPFLSEDD